MTTRTKEEIKARRKKAKKLNIARAEIQMKREELELEDKARIYFKPDLSHVRLDKQSLTDIVTNMINTSMHMTAGYGIPPRRTSNDMYLLKATQALVDYATQAFRFIKEAKPLLIKNGLAKYDDNGLFIFITDE